MGEGRKPHTLFCSAVLPQKAAALDQQKPSLQTTGGVSEPEWELPAHIGAGRFLCTSHFCSLGI